MIGIYFSNIARVVVLKVPLNHAILFQETGLNREERSVCLITLKSLLEINKVKKLYYLSKKGPANQCAGA